jgi:CheY-like chemotaxis protein
VRRIELLAIEDSPTDLFWLSAVLARLGIVYSLSTVDTGEQAVNFLLKRREFTEAPTPDLVLLDMHLPILTGIEVLHEVPHAERLPICVLTSSEAEREIFKEEYGIEGLQYMVKPVSAEKLLNCFRCYAHLRPIADELSGQAHEPQPR